MLSPDTVMWLERRLKKEVWLILLTCVSGVLMVGVMTEVYLEDEITHYPFAKRIFKGLSHFVYLATLGVSIL